MSLRIISGAARGLRIAVPSGDVRPTLDRVRQAAFNILQQDVPGARFLDLFAGSGANGIEALSRGARRAVLADHDAGSIRVIERNLAHVRLGPNATVIRLELPGGLSRLRSLGPFEIIYADPPHTFDAMDGLAEGIRSNNLLADGGVLIWEHAWKGVDPASLPEMHHERTTRYGGTALSFYS